MVHKGLQATPIQRPDHVDNPDTLNSDFFLFENHELFIYIYIYTHTGLSV